MYRNRVIERAGRTKRKKKCVTKSVEDRFVIQNFIGDYSSSHKKGLLLNHQVHRGKKHNYKKIRSNP